MSCYEKTPKAKSCLNKITSNSRRVSVKWAMKTPCSRAYSELLRLTWNPGFFGTAASGLGTFLVLPFLPFLPFPTFPHLSIPPQSRTTSSALPPPVISILTLPRQHPRRRYKHRRQRRPRHHRHNRQRCFCRRKRAGRCSDGRYQGTWRHDKRYVW